MHMDSQMLTPVQRPELKLQPSEVTIELIELIQRMEPFGQDMPEPLAAGGVFTCVFMVLMCLVMYLADYARVLRGEKR